MPKQDFSDYERRLATDHEQQYRMMLTETLMWIDCERRRCRRDRGCTGPMLVSVHQSRKVIVQREIGLSGHACARLPACIANLPENLGPSLQKIRDEWLDLLIKSPPERLPKFDRRLKDGKQRRDIADP